MTRNWSGGTIRSKGSEKPCFRYRIGDESKDRKFYCMYVRNRLLSSVIATTRYVYTEMRRGGNNERVSREFILMHLTFGYVSYALNLSSQFHLQL